MTVSAGIPSGVRIIGGTAMLGLACAVGYAGAWLLRRNYKFATKGVAATGEVVGWEIRGTPEITFQTADGRKIAFVASSGSGRPPKRGTKVRVLYIPDNPQDAAVASLLPFWVWPSFLFVLATVFLAVSILFYTGGFAN
jgi:hypothetical protein